jgi:hypothetical protein
VDVLPLPQCVDLNKLHNLVLAAVDSDTDPTGSTMHNKLDEQTQQGLETVTLVTILSIIISRTQQHSQFGNLVTTVHTPTVLTPPAPLLWRCPQLKPSTNKQQATGGQRQ